MSKIDVSDLENSENFLPPKLYTVARSIRKGLPILKNDGRLRFARKQVATALGCRRFVSDDEILGIFQDKLAILERENIFDSNRFDSGYERDLMTKDQDRVIYVEFHKKAKAEDLPYLESNFLTTRNNDNEDIPEISVPGLGLVKNKKFSSKIREQEQDQQGQQEQGTQQDQQGQEQGKQQD